MRQWERGAGKVPLDFLAIGNQVGFGGIFQHIGVDPIRGFSGSFGRIDAHIKAMRAELFEHRLGALGEDFAVLLPIVGVNSVKRLFVPVGVDVIIRTGHEVGRYHRIGRIPLRDTAVGIAGALRPHWCEILAESGRFFR